MGVGPKSTEDVMRMRIPFIAGAAIGYVLGTKAGRERYEQIVQQSKRLRENPRVQETAETLRAKSGELAGTARQKVGARRHGEHGEPGKPLPEAQTGAGTTAGTTTGAGTTAGAGATAGAETTAGARRSETGTPAGTGTSGAGTGRPTGTGTPSGTRRPR
jgi:hypothetical protein